MSLGYLCRVIVIPSNNLKTVGEFHKIINTSAITTIDNRYSAPIYDGSRDCGPSYPCYLTYEKLGNSYMSSQNSLNHICGADNATMPFKYSDNNQNCTHFNIMFFRKTYIAMTPSELNCSLINVRREYKTNTKIENALITTFIQPLYIVLKHSKIFTKIKYVQKNTNSIINNSSAANNSLLSTKEPINLQSEAPKSSLKTDEILLITFMSILGAVVIAVLGTLLYLHNKTSESTNNIQMT